jgi:hypothetical protein
MNYSECSLWLYDMLNQLLAKILTFVLQLILVDCGLFKNTISMLIMWENQGGNVKCLIFAAKSTTERTERRSLNLLLPEQAS